ncbi:LuxR family transcriptional regulator, partial [Cryptosporangium minutisporangium]
AAAAFLTRATELTPDRSTRARRALDAAFAAVVAGAFDAARALLPVCTVVPVDAWHEARIDLLRSQLAFASSRGKEAIPLLLTAARRLEPLDLEMARATYLDALVAAVIGSRLNDGVGPAEVAKAVRAAPRPSGGPSSGDLLLDAFCALVEEREDAVGTCRDALAALRSDPEPKLRHLWESTILAIALWDDESWDAVSERHIRLARETGALGELPFMLGSRVHFLGYCGDLSAAAALVAEEHSVVEATGSGGPAPYGALCVAAWQGRDRDARELLGIARRVATASDEGTGVALTECWHALLRNGLGEYEAAFTAAARATEDPSEFATQCWGLPELIEAAARTGRADVAADALERLTERTTASGSRWARGLEARCRALVTGSEEDYRGRSTSWAGPVPAPTRLAPICCMGSGCAGRAAGATLGAS